MLPRSKSGLLVVAATLGVGFCAASVARPIEADRGRPSNPFRLVQAPGQLDGNAKPKKRSYTDDGIHWCRGRDYGSNLQLTPRGNGWERQMVEYPSVVKEGDRLRMVYCGNGYGRTGIGTAISGS